MQVASLPDNVSQTPVAIVTEGASEWASGTLQSASRTAVSSRILARIEDVKVAAGDRVNTGDVLVLLDARELKARAQQASDAQRAAVAKQELAQAEMQRADELLKRGVGTSKRYDEAVAKFRTVLAQDPDNPAVHRNLGTTLARKGDAAAAETAFRRSLELGPNDPMTRFLYADLLARTGRVEAARAELEAALRLDPRHGPAQQLLGSLPPGP